MFLVSCTSTGSSLDTASTGLQPALTTTAPLPSNPPQVTQVATASAPQVTPANPSLIAQSGAPAPQLPATEPGKIEVAAVEPAATQLDKNSKLVADAAAAASAKAAADGAAPAQPTPETAPAVANAATQVAPAPQGDAQPVAGQAVATNEAQAAPAQAAPTPAAPAAASQTVASAANNAPVLTAAPPAEQTLTAAPVEAAPAKKKTLFDSLFGSSKKSSGKSDPNLSEVAPEPTQLALATPEPPLKKAKVAVEPVLQPAKLDLSKLEEQQPDGKSDAPAVDNGELPGVRKGALFEIKRRDSLQDDTDVDIGETDGGPVLLASAGGLARLAPNGLKVQRESVDVACLKPQLVKLIKSIERHYNSTAVITSGYRSPGYNRRVRGAKNSLHMFCAAADIQVVGVGKWELARYARSMPGRGGVGTYCHTDSIHVDVGPDRDWNWRCSRRK